MQRALLPMALLLACDSGGGGAGADADVIADSARPEDAASRDAGTPPDAAAPDGAAPDAATPDGAAPDAATPDGSAPDSGRPEVACPLDPALACDGAPGFASGQLSRAACPPDVECEDDGCCWQSRWQDFRLAVYLVHPGSGASVEMTVCEERALRDARVAAGEPLPPFTWRVAADSSAFEPGDAVHVYTSDLGDWGPPAGENGDCYSRLDLVLDGARRACVVGEPRARCQ